MVETVRPTPVFATGGANSLLAKGINFVLAVGTVLLLVQLLIDGRSILHVAFALVFCVLGVYYARWTPLIYEVWPDRLVVRCIAARREHSFDSIDRIYRSVGVESLLMQGRPYFLYVLPWQRTFTVMQKRTSGIRRLQFSVAPRDASEFMRVLQALAPHVAAHESS